MRNLRWDKKIRVGLVDDEILVVIDDLQDSATGNEAGPVKGYSNIPKARFDDEGAYVQVLKVNPREL